MLNFRQGMQPGMFGPPGMGAMTPKNNEGLGLPGGQAMFNLPRTAPAPGTNVNFPTNAPVGGGYGAPSLKMSITRTASSDPVQNIINDLQNPLNSTDVNVAPAEQPKTEDPFAMFMGMGQPQKDSFAPIGIQGPPNFPIGVPQFGLRSRIMQAAAMGGGMQPHPFL